MHSCISQIQTSGHIIVHCMTSFWTGSVRNNTTYILSRWTWFYRKRLVRCRKESENGVTQMLVGARNTSKEGWQVALKGRAFEVSIVVKGLVECEKQSTMFKGSLVQCVAWRQVTVAHGVRCAGDGPGRSLENMALSPRLLDCLRS